jgi:hypothetical protein
MAGAGSPTGVLRSGSPPPQGQGCRRPPRDPGAISKAWDLCRVKAQSSDFAPQAERYKPPLTSRFVIPCCPLLSPRFRRVAAPARPTQVLSGPVGATQRCRSLLELVFDRLVRWGPGTTRTWAGRSQHRCSGARSCSTSTWPPSVRWPPTSSPTSAPTAPGSGASCSSSDSSGPRPTSAAEAATLTVDALRPQVCRAHARARLLSSSASWNPDCPMLPASLAVLSRRRFSRAYCARAQLLEQ